MEDVLRARLIEALRDENDTPEYDDICDAAENAFMEKDYQKCRELLESIGH